MNKLVLIAAAATAAVAWWWSGRVDMGPPSPNGFVAVAMPDGAPANTVVILAPLNSPSDGAQRAARLADSLTRAGVPNVMSDSYSVELPEPTDEERLGMERAVVIMNGTIPAVFINGMASANPSAEQVVAEYRRTK